ncbi:MAG: hypothetical protein AAF690_09485 [Acidobacteriota bacterium]
MKPTARFLLALLTLLLFSGPASGYTLFLKDGSQVLCQQKYSVQGDRVLVVLESGQTTAYRLGDVDFEKTDAFNRNNSGNAVVLDGREIRPLERSGPSPADRDLGDLIRERRATGATVSSSREPVRRPQANLRRTAAGYVDLNSLQRRPLENRDVAEALDLALRKADIRSFKVYQGTTPEAVFLEVTADSKNAVFNALQGVARIQQTLGAGYGINSFELLLQTSGRGRAGQFVLDSSDAALLASESAPIEQFFLENVQF